MNMAEKLKMFFDREIKSKLQTSEYTDTAIDAIKERAMREGRATVKASAEYELGDTLLKLMAVNDDFKADFVELGKKYADEINKLTEGTFSGG